MQPPCSPISHSSQPPRSPLPQSDKAVQPASQCDEYQLAHRTELVSVDKHRWKTHAHKINIPISGAQIPLKFERSLMMVKTTGSERGERVNAPRRVKRVTSRKLPALKTFGKKDASVTKMMRQRIHAVNGAFKATSGRNFDNYHSAEAGKNNDHQQPLLPGSRLS